MVATLRKWLSRIRPSLSVGPRRPRLALVGIALVTVLLALAFWQYALHQWKQAQGAMQSERLNVAREKLAFCLRIWPRSPEVHQQVARLYRLMGDLGGAETHLNRSIELQGGATEAVQLEFLLLRVQAGEVDQLAPILFDAVDKGHPDSPMILETIARTFLLRLRYKLGYASLTKWIEIQPEHAKPYYWRGWALERLNNPKSAKDDYIRALELNGDLVPARLRLAEMYLEDKQAPEAFPHLERLMQLAPNNPEVQARTGICLFLLGRAEEGHTLMMQAVQTMPEDPPLLVALANYDLQRGNGVEAEHWVRTVLAGDPSDTESLFVLASALQLQGRNEESERTLTEYERKRDVVERINALLKDKADNPSATADDYMEIGTLFLEIGRQRYGVYWLEQALERNPVHQAAHRALAEHYERVGDANSAAIHRRQIRTGSPEARPPTNSPP